MYVCIYVSFQFSQQSLNGFQSNFYTTIIVHKESFQTKRIHRIMYSFFLMETSDILMYELYAAFQMGTINYRLLL